MIGRRKSAAQRATGVHYCVPAMPEQVTALRHTLVDWMRRSGLPADTVDAVALATTEAMTNVVEHAYDGHPGLLDVDAAAEPAEVTITVTDHGRWRPPPVVPTLLHGRGLPLIEGMAGDSAVTPGPRGTTVRMSWPLGSYPQTAARHRSSHRDAVSRRRWRVRGCDRERFRPH